MSKKTEAQKRPSIGSGIALLLNSISLDYIEGKQYLTHPHKGHINEVDIDIIAQGYQGENAIGMIRAQVYKHTPGADPFNLWEGFSGEWSELYETFFLEPGQPKYNGEDIILLDTVCLNPQFRGQGITGIALDQLSLSFRTASPRLMILHAGPLSKDYLHDQRFKGFDTFNVSFSKALASLKAFWSALGFAPLRPGMSTFMYKVLPYIETTQEAKDKGMNEEEIKLNRRYHLPRLCIDPIDAVIGYPIVFVRDFLKRHRMQLQVDDAIKEFYREHYKTHPEPDTYTYRVSEEYKELQKLIRLRASTFMDLLEVNGYITCTFQEPYRQWDLTEKGYLMANAYVGKPLPYKAAKKRVDALLKRVDEIKSSPKFLYKVKRLYVFGHYATQADQVSSIDVAVEMESKLQDEGKTNEIKRAISKNAIRERRWFTRDPWFEKAEAGIAEQLQLAGKKHIRLFYASDYILNQLKPMKIYEDTASPSDDNGLYEAICHENLYIEDRVTYIKSKIAKNGFVISSDTGITCLDSRIYYTVGLYLQKGHPEILLLGPRPKEGNYIIARIGRLVVEGRTFEAMKVYSDVFDQTPIVFHETDEERQDDVKRMEVAQEVYGDIGFPIYQVFFADKNGKFPWEEGSDGDCADLQGFSSGRTDEDE
jgi:predicted nucleotidyltransferase